MYMLTRTHTLTHIHVHRHTHMYTRTQTTHILIYIYFDSVSREELTGVQERSTGRACVSGERTRRAISSNWRLPRVVERRLLVEGVRCV